MNTNVEKVLRHEISVFKMKIKVENKKIEIGGK